MAIINNFDLSKLSQKTIETLETCSSKQMDLLLLEQVKLERRLKEIKAKTDKYSADILDLMTENNLETFSTDYFKFSIKKGYSKQVVDTDKLKQAGLYDSYLKTCEVKPSLHKEVKDLLDA